MSGFLTEWLDWQGRTNRARCAVTFVIFFTFLLVGRVATDLMGQPAHLTGVVAAVFTLLAVSYEHRPLHDMGQNGIGPVPAQNVISQPRFALFSSAGPSPVTVWRPVSSWETR